MTDQSLSFERVFDFSDKTVLVTGAANGIGLAIAELFGERGAKLALLDKSAQVAETAKTLGASARGFEVDITDEADVARTIAAVVAEFGRIDVLCNNAGTSIKTAARDFEKVTVEEWDHIFGVNVKGVFLATKHAVPLLKRSEDACIVNTNSIVGARPGPQALPYAASKGALWTMTKSLAGALGYFGIRVNGVAPGWIAGEWMERMLGEHYDELMKARAKATPLRRVVTAEDVAETAMSLIEGNKSVTGMIVVVDGGFSAVT